MTTWDDNRIAELRVLFERGLSCSRIALVMNCGITRNAVIGKLNRLGLTTHRAPLSAEERAERKARKYQNDRDRRVAERLLNRVQKVNRLLARVQKAVEPEPVTGGTDLLDLQEGQCRWPHGEQAPYRFCANEAFEGLPYCAGHARVAYQPHVRRRAA